MSATKPNDIAFVLQKQLVIGNRSTLVDYGVVDFEAYTPAFGHFYDPGIMTFFPAQKRQPMVVNVTNITLATDLYVGDAIEISMPGGCRLIIFLKFEKIIGFFCHQVLRMVVGLDWLRTGLAGDMVRARLKAWIVLS